MLVVVSTERSSKKSIVDINHFEIVGKSNSSLDGRVVRIMRGPKSFPPQGPVPFNP